MISQSRRLRRFAAHVLLLWLFALGTAVVNACIVPGHLAQAEPAIAQEHGHMSIAAGHDADDQAAVHGEAPQPDPADRTQPPCQRLCDGPSASPPSEKLQSNLLTAFWLAPAPMPSIAIQSAIDPVRIVPSDPHRWRAAIPISIAFLRLAL